MDMRYLSCSPSGRKDNKQGMTDDKDAAAVALGQKRWANASAKERKQHSKMMNANRWAGHVAKRPASIRKSAAKQARAKAR